jgi:peptide deformylase
MKLLRRTQFGNPILRKSAQRLDPKQIRSTDVQDLIRDMFYTLESKQYGVGLAAPQVGHSLAIAVISLRPTDHRPDVVAAKLTIINPEVIKSYGRRTGLWEGCLSFGTGRNTPFAQVPRHQKIRVKYLDEQGIICEHDFSGLLAHVIQHEIDHLNGLLFVDHVRDTTTYMTLSEYRKRIVQAD